MNQKYEIPKDTPTANCKGCKAFIFWIKTSRGKNMPVDPDGTPHWNSCPSAPKAKTGKTFEQLNKENASMAHALVRIEYQLSDWEKMFVHDIADRLKENRPLTNEQAAKLREIHDRRLMEGADSSE